MIRSYFSSWQTSWNSFWFSKQAPETLALMRILVGSMLVYTHIVWATGGQIFFGESGVIPSGYRNALFGPGNGAWSFFDWLPGDAWLMPAHIAAIAIFVCFTLGFATRITSILSWLLVVSYANRMIGTQFGLDQVNSFLTLYLAIGSSGAAYSIDAWRSNRTRAGQGRHISPTREPNVSNNIATRLMQIHLCVVYLFAGIGKAQGLAWLNGDAMLMALSSYEYQSLNLVWLVHHMWLINLTTLIALAWEISYAALVWPNKTRPIMLGLAVAVHVGIGAAMGMITFGLAMIFANIAFVRPETIRRIEERFRPNEDHARPITSKG